MQSLEVTAVARTLMRTSPRRGVGSSRSRNWSTSGRPYLVHTMAFIWRCPPSVPRRGVGQSFPGRWLMHALDPGHLPRRRHFRERVYSADLLKKAFAVDVLACPLSPLTGAARASVRRRPRQAATTGAVRRTDTVEQINTANDALYDWQDIVPEDVEELRSRLLARVENGR